MGPRGQGFVPRPVPRAQPGPKAFPQRARRVVGEKRQALEAAPCVPHERLSTLAGALDDDGLTGKVLIRLRPEDQDINQRGEEQGVPELPLAKVVVTTSYLRAPSWRRAMWAATAQRARWLRAERRLWPTLDPTGS